MITPNRDITYANHLMRSPRESWRTEGERQITIGEIVEFRLRTHSFLMRSAPQPRPNPGEIGEFTLALGQEGEPD